MRRSGVRSSSSPPTRKHDGPSRPVRLFCPRSNARGARAHAHDRQGPCTRHLAWWGPAAARLPRDLPVICSAAAEIGSEGNRRSGPSVALRPGSCERLRSLAPAVTGIASGPAPPPVEQRLASRIEREKSQYFAALRSARRAITADQLVVRQPAIRQRDSAPRLDGETRAQGQAWTEYQCVQQIPLEPEQARHGAIVVWARQGRNEVDASRRTSLQEAASRYFDDDLDFRRC